MSLPRTRDELARMRDERAQAIQQAVKRARMEWAREDKAELDRLKAQWQAEAISRYAAERLGGTDQELAEIYASKLRRQANQAEESS